jgi:hypothetical protein
MRHSLPWLMLGWGLPGTALVSGCCHTCQRCDTCARIGRPVRHESITVSPVPGITYAEPPLIPTTTPSPTLPLPVATVTTETTPLHRVSKTEPPLATEVNTAPEWHSSSKPTHSEVPVSAFSHADDFSWIRGVLEQGRRPNIWLLRFAPVEVTDGFAGCVTLVLDEDNARNLQSGQTVRVEGALMDPDAGGSRPGYRVTAIKAIDRP